MLPAFPFLVVLRGLCHAFDLNYLEVDVAVFVHVKCAEHVVAELHGVPGWEEHLVHVHEFGRGQSSVRAILLQLGQRNKNN